MWAYFMLAPAILLFITFVLIPLVSTFVISFCEWDMLTPAEFVGWQNFETLLNDQRLRTVIINTLIFADCRRDPQNWNRITVGRSGPQYSK